MAELKKQGTLEISHLGFQIGHCNLNFKKTDLILSMQVILTKVTSK